MFIRLSDAIYERHKGDIQRPLRVTIDADIPPGSAVLLQVECLDKSGQPKRAVFRNPFREPAPTLVIKRIGLGFEIPERSLAVPFVYGVIIEFNGWKYVYNATSLFEAREKQGTQRQENWQLMLPEILEEVDRFAPDSIPDLEIADENSNEQENRNVISSTSEEVPTDFTPERPYLTVVPFAGALVRASRTQKPYIIEIDGGGYSDSFLHLVVATSDESGTMCSLPIDVTGSDDDYCVVQKELPISSLGNFRLEKIELRPSSDLYHAPSLSGIAIEGDGRRFYMGAGDLLGDADLPESFELIRFSNSRASMLTLKHDVPEFFDFPSAMNRLSEMAQSGELNPNWSHGQPLRYGLIQTSSAGECTLPSHNSMNEESANLADFSEEEEHYG